MTRSYQTLNPTKVLTAAYKLFCPWGWGARTKVSGGIPEETPSTQQIHTQGKNHEVEPQFREGSRETDPIARGGIPLRR